MRHVYSFILLLFCFVTQAQCDFTIELKDSESNGWAGSSLDLSVDGSLIYDDLSISNGQASEVFTFSVNNNDAIEVTWNPGSVGQDETSYSILDNTGKTLITKTATNLLPNEINVNCATCPLPQNIQLEYANDPLEEARFSFDLPSSQQLNQWSYEWVIMPQGQSPNPSSAIEDGTLNLNSYAVLNQEITTSVDTSTYSNFDFYIRTNCEDLSFSQWSSVISFCFSCGQSDPLKPPYFENFFFNFDTELGYTEGDDGSLASGPSVTGQGNWTTDFFANGGVGSDPDSFKISMDGNDDVSWLILPPFDLSDTDYIMSYELAVTADNSSTSGSDMGSDDVIYLAYKTSGSGSWTILEDYDNSDGLSYINNGTEEIDLSAITSSSVQLAFVAFENADDPEDYDFFVDEIRLEKRPCQIVFQNLNVDQVTSNTVDISWDASPDEVSGYDWYVFNNNDNPLFAAPVQTGATSAGSSQVTITGLASQTDYDFYLKTNCSSTQSAFSPLLNFSTICGVFSAPFSESFEPTSNSEECWTTINADNDNEAWNLDDPNGPNQGAESASIGGIADDGDDDWLISPQFNLSGNEKLKFAVRSFSSNNPSNLEVLLSTTGNNPADFTTVLLPDDTINDFNYIQKTIDLSSYSGNVYIAWYVNNTADSYGLFVDDIEIIDYNVNYISGNVRFDENGNGCDSNDNVLSQFPVNTNDGQNDLSVITDDQGDYLVTVNQGNFNVTMLNLPDYFDASPTSHNVNFNATDELEDQKDFCITANQDVEDLSIEVFPLDDARPGFESEYEIIVKNFGTQTQNNIQVDFSFNDTYQSFVSASQSANQNGNSLSFDISSLSPYTTEIINLTLLNVQPPNLNSGDVLSFDADVSPNTNDINPDDNTVNFDQTVVNSFDPNDKLVTQGEQIPDEKIDEYLDYKIRFQNVGTVNAINVTITDTISDKLDWTTFQPINSSHNYRLELVEQEEINFIFENINLPYEAIDEPGSNGHVSFKIKPKSDVQIGDIIENKAYIFFDFNAPIITNTVSTEIVDELSTTDFVKAENIKLSPNPADDRVEIINESNATIKSLQLYSIKGQLIKTFSNEGLLDISQLSSSVYILQIETQHNKINKRLIKR